MEKARFLLLWVWQFPQHLLALVLVKITDATRLPYKRSVYVYDGYPWLSGVSLGWYIFLPERKLIVSTILHEEGHSKQSLMFGPLYLLVIGIPSVCNNLWDRWFHKSWSSGKRQHWYYNRYPEAWADRLGGVERVTNE